MRPSSMTRDEFIAAFGGVFEHSPWIAEAVYDDGLAPEHDSPDGLHAAMVAVFRGAGEAKRLEVLRAHPDLAGKLAAAGRLTEDSAKEQAGVGLDMLTDAERAEFTRLNAAYAAKFGFPFIIAVADYDKAGILAAFTERLEYDRQTEFQEACLQVERIAALRLNRLFSR